MNETWRCQACTELMYNTEWVEGRVLPAPGAPEPNYGSLEFNAICCVCKVLLETVKESTYMTNLHKEYVESIKNVRNYGKKE